MTVSTRCVERLRLCAFAIAVAGLGALIGAFGAKAQSAPTTPKIAASLSLTGPSAIFGRPSLDGVTLAVEEANAERGAVKIEFEPYDDATDENVAMNNVDRIAATDALMMIGPATTPMALTAVPECAEQRLVCIGTTATADSLTQHAMFFRPIFSAGDAGEAMADYLRYILGGSRAVVLVKNDGYGHAVADRFAKAAGRLGVAVTQRVFDTQAEAEQDAHLAAVDPDHPAIVLSMIAENYAVVKVLRRDGAQGPILGTNAIGDENFSARFEDEPEERQRPGYFTEGIYALAPILFDSANAETLAFADRFRARFGQYPNYIAAQGYESAKLAIAAARAVSGRGAPSDVAARRKAVQSYLMSLDGPVHAIAGLNGALWFTPDRGRQEALRMGRFHNRRLDSAPAQLVPVHNFDPAEIASGAVVDIGEGSYARRQQVVYTGVYLNELPRVDVGQSTFTADFYLWLRYARNAGAGAADPTEIDFPDLVRGTFDPKKPTREGDLDDGTTYRLWRMRGDFKNDYDLHRYPFDRQDLIIRLFNARADSDRIAYVQDRRSAGGGLGEPPPDSGAPPANAQSAAVQSAGGQSNAALPNDVPTGAIGGSGSGEPADGFRNVALDAFHNLTQWEPLGITQERDNVVTQSALGDPRLVGLERVLELSGFRVAVALHRRVGATLAKSLLPLGLMSLILLASLYFPAGLVKEKITVAVTAALSGAVLLTAINTQLGGIGYVIAVEYLFYVFFALCVFCILTVLLAERLRTRKYEGGAVVVEHSARILFVIAAAATGLTAYLITWQW
jgi:ABC-type branched-subunit amino acid transport system substrate-binding protein